MNHQHRVAGEVAVRDGEGRHQRDAGRINLGFAEKQEFAAREPPPRILHFQHQPAAEFRVSARRRDFQGDIASGLFCIRQGREEITNHVLIDLAQQRDLRGIEAGGMRS